MPDHKPTTPRDADEILYVLVYLECSAVSGVTIQRDEQAAQDEYNDWWERTLEICYNAEGGVVWKPDRYGISPAEAAAMSNAEIIAVIREAHRDDGDYDLVLLAQAIEEPHPQGEQQ
jgi:hypothetical protein